MPWLVSSDGERLVYYCGDGKIHDAPPEEGDLRSCHPPMFMDAKGQVLKFSCCSEEKPACRRFTLVQGISVLLSSCCINCLNVAALIKFHVEDFRTTLAYSYLSIIGKRGSCSSLQVMPCRSMA